MLLQRAAVPFYWVLSPEDKTLIAYALDSGSYRVAFSVECRDDGAPSDARISPFDEIAIDLAYLFGGDE